MSEWRDLLTEPELTFLISPAGEHVLAKARRDYRLATGHLGEGEEPPRAYLAKAVREAYTEYHAELARGEPHVNLENPDFREGWNTAAGIIKQAARERGKA